LNLIEEGKVAGQKWEEDKIKLYQDILALIKDNVNQADIEEWIFSYKPINNGNRNHQKNFHNSEISILTNAYKSIGVNKLDFNEIQNSFNLQKFNFYTELLLDRSDENVSQDSVNDILNALVNYIKSENFYWDSSYSEPYWSAMKKIAFLLSKKEKPIEEVDKLIKAFGVNHQGWKITSIDYKPLVKESFILCGIVMLFEYDNVFKNVSDKELFFKQLLNLILTQSRFSVIDYSKFYKMPLQLLFLLVNQIYTEQKSYYEKELINSYDNLLSLSSILRSFGYNICEESKEFIRKRKDEFLIEKRKLSNRKQRDEVEFLDNVMMDWNINI
ncbi:hypothetical protein EZS27_032754, partial [termite gut metagenome]